MNLGTFSGRLGRDAEARATPAGERVANFALAVDVGSKANPKTMWVDCSIWGKRADSLSPYLIKGTKITASGRVTIEEYKKTDGTMASKLQLVVNDLDLHSKVEGGSAPAPAASKSLADMDDDNPF